MTWRIPTLFLILAAPAAMAHTGVDAADGYTAGLLHPVSGLDHLLAMFAVGLWGAQLGGRALWTLPVAFVSVMLLGSLAGANGLALPFVEGGILASVLVLGLLIARAQRLPMPASLLLVALFALCHGFAHGTEMPLAASGLIYGIGFGLTTALLHLSGAIVGLRLKDATARFAGLAIAATGLILMA